MHRQRDVAHNGAHFDGQGSLADQVAGAVANDVRVTVSGRSIGSSHVMRENRVTLQLAEPVTLQAGQDLAVEIGLRRPF